MEMGDSSIETLKMGNPSKQNHPKQNPTNPLAANPGCAEHQCASSSNSRALRCGVRSTRLSVRTLPRTQYLGDKLQAPFERHMHPSCPLTLTETQTKTPPETRLSWWLREHWVAGVWHSWRDALISSSLGIVLELTLPQLSRVSGI